MPAKKQAVPADPGRKRQVKTTKQKYGPNVYRLRGRKGGGVNSPGSFTSDSARAASLKSWENRRARQTEQEEKI